jgi:hypothetical protein
LPLFKTGKCCFDLSFADNTAGMEIMFIFGYLM